MLSYFMVQARILRACGRMPASDYAKSIILRLPFGEPASNAADKDLVSVIDRTKVGDFLPKKEVIVNWGVYNGS